jgi:hypothetical protein
VQGSARVIQCLQDGRDQLGVYCRAALFDFEQDMAEDIDFKAPLKVKWLMPTKLTTANRRKSCGQHGRIDIAPDPYVLLTACGSLEQAACAGEISTFCPDVPHGHARIIRCLQVPHVFLTPALRVILKTVQSLLFHMLQTQQPSVRSKQPLLSVTMSLAAKLQVPWCNRTSWMMRPWVASAETRLWPTQSARQPTTGALLMLHYVLSGCLSSMRALASRIYFPNWPLHASTL